MERALKQRLIGAAVLIAIAVIFLPMLVKGPAPVSGAAESSIRLTEPLLTWVVMAAHSDEASTPRRSSLPSISARSAAVAE